MSRWLPRRLLVVAILGGSLLSLLAPMAANVMSPMPYQRFSASAPDVGGVVATPDGGVYCRGWVINTRSCTRRLFHVDRNVPVRSVDPMPLPAWITGRLEHHVADGNVIVVDSRGWPWRAAYASGVVSGGTVRAVRGGILAPKYIARSTTVPTLIPLTPRIPALLGNAAVFAAIILGVGVPATVLRRAWRYERGLCPDCSYRLHSRYDRPCPECGNAAAITERETDDE